ncbi:eukaryotic membrane protein family-domain-containing protein [Epithele typhae]|uniref:eukaryotic membrane protein family-domain-containing protein n=1 Tax=Epithele typhae TaxID=378194 RepID=UPI00200780DC|nr:eukaryotic membrane protein family-domain-containing protein [Epithele typhae]KAH9942279.1 eukaryotic membrane protein family-domain-containing protein [Epithele typhae]
MPHTTRGSPKRKRLRRYFSASAATGARWNPKLLAVPGGSSSSQPRKRSASVSSDETFDFPPDHTQDNFQPDEYVYNEAAHAFSSRNIHPEPTPQRQPLTYASLPPTPISPSPPLQPTLTAPLPSFPSLDSIHEPPFSIWDYLREEILATDFDSHQELKWERVGNFLRMPIALEKIFFFGFIVCLDSFMYTFTILPIRFVLAAWRLSLNTFSCSAPALPPSQKADLLRALLLVLSVVVLAPLTDASKLYHFIRGQETIKLYVIFNALEIADRLCASIGQDVIDCLFSRSNLEAISHRKRPTSQLLWTFVYFMLALVYTVSHALVLMYQMISLNVAVNSYDHALLTLLVSNQFVEIKGSVFKKFEKDNLFQITCADIVERFTLVLMLIVVAFRNLIELSGSTFTFGEGFALPTSFGWFRGNNVVWTISYPVLTVMVSETLVDWLKHAFITKFNHIRPSVYERYTDVLCRDLASGSAVGRRGARKHTYVDQSPLVARRLGFASLPLAVHAILIGYQSVALLISMHADESPLWTRPWNEYTPNDWTNFAKWAALAVLCWGCFLVLKIMLGVQLVTYATRRRAGMEAREDVDKINDFGRDPIGEGKEEKRYNKELKGLLDSTRDDASPVPDIGERKPGDPGGKKKRLQLDEITRFTMVKRIW